MLSTKKNNIQAWTNKEVVCMYNNFHSDKNHQLLNVFTFITRSEYYIKLRIPMPVCISFCKSLHVCFITNLIFLCLTLWGYFCLLPLYLTKIYYDNRFFNGFFESSQKNKFAIYSNTFWYKCKTASDWQKQIAFPSRERWDNSS